MADKFDRDQVEQYNTQELDDTTCEECGHDLLLHADKYGCQYEPGDTFDGSRAKPPCGCKAHEAKRETLWAIEEHMRRIRQAIRKNDDFLLGALRKAGVIQ